MKKRLPVTKRTRKTKKTAPSKNTSRDIESLDLDFADDLIGIRKALSDQESGYRKHLYIHLSTVYGTALELAKNVDEWNTFCTSRHWNDYKTPPKRDCNDDALWHCLRLLCGSDREAGKKASKYNAALRDLFEQKIPAEKIPSILEKGGGIEKMARKDAPKSNSSGIKNLSLKISPEHEAALNGSEQLYLGVILAKRNKKADRRSNNNEGISANTS